MDKNVSSSLMNALADSYVLFLKTQYYHWNVTGPNFQSLHVMFEDQYNDLFAAIDLIAERIRALGKTAPGSFSEYSKLTSLQEANTNCNALQMVKDLAEDQSKIIKTLSVVLHAAQDIGDEVTVGIMTDRLEVHEKNAWMLKSSM